MRWRGRQKKPELKLGTQRTRFGFLWHPQKIGDEWRWLEYAGWVEEWCSWPIDGVRTFHGWGYIKWISTEKPIWMR